MIPGQVRAGPGHLFACFRVCKLGCGASLSSFGHACVVDSFDHACLFRFMSHVVFLVANPVFSSVP